MKNFEKNIKVIRNMLAVKGYTFRSLVEDTQGICYLTAYNTKENNVPVSIEYCNEENLLSELAEYLFIE